MSHRDLLFVVGRGRRAAVLFLYAGEANAGSEGCHGLLKRHLYLSIHLQRLDSRNISSVYQLFLYAVCPGPSAWLGQLHDGGCQLLLLLTSVIDWVAREWGEINVGPAL